MEGWSSGVYVGMVVEVGCSFCQFILIGCWSGKFEVGIGEFKTAAGDWFWSGRLMK